VAFVTTLLAIIGLAVALVVIAALLSGRQPPEDGQRPPAPGPGEGPGEHGEDPH
jgi:hypothetical protein